MGDPRMLIRVASPFPCTLIRRSDSVLPWILSDDAQKEFLIFLLYQLRCERWKTIHERANLVAAVGRLTNEQNRVSRAKAARVDRSEIIVDVLVLVLPSKGQFALGLRSIAHKNPVPVTQSTLGLDFVGMGRMTYDNLDKSWQRPFAQEL